MLILLVATVPVSSLQLAQTPPSVGELGRVRIEADSNHAAIVLEWTEPVEITTHRSGPEWVLRSSRPLPGGLDAAWPRLSGWVSDLHYGYDSLLLVRLPDTELRHGTTATSVTISLTHRPPSPPEKRPDEEAAREDRGAKLRLDRQVAELRAAKGDAVGARGELRGLVARHPDEIQTIVDLSELEARLGRWGKAIALYDRMTARSRWPRAIRARSCRPKLPSCASTARAFEPSSS